MKLNKREIIANMQEVARLYDADENWTMVDLANGFMEFVIVEFSDADELTLPELMVSFYNFKKDTK